MTLTYAEAIFGPAKTAEWHEGAAHREANGVRARLTHNPYPKDSQKADDWHCGYMNCKPFRGGKQWPFSA